MQLPEKSDEIVGIDALLVPPVQGEDSRCSRRRANGFLSLSPAGGERGRPATAFSFSPVEGAVVLKLVEQESLDEGNPGGGTRAPFCGPTPAIGEV